MFWNSLYESVIQNLHSINTWQIYLKDLRAHGIDYSQQYANNLEDSIKRRKIKKA